MQQFNNELGGSDAASPSPYDYEADTNICYSPLDIVSVLNATDNLTYFQEALFYTGVAGGACFS